MSDFLSSKDLRIHAAGNWVRIKRKKFYGTREEYLFI